MPSTKASHLRGCILYFFLFMSHGSVDPFLPLIWRSKGISEYEIGLLGAIRPVVAVLFAPAVCALADRRGIQQQVLYVLITLYSISRPSVLAAGSVLVVAALEALASISGTPIGTLVDSAVRQSFGASGYGKQRMWGAVGFGVASLIGGFVSDTGSGGYGGVMVVFVAVMVVALVAATGVTIGNIQEEAGSPAPKGQSEISNGGSSDYGATRELEPGRKEDARNDKTSGTGVAAADTTSTATIPVSSCDSSSSLVDGGTPDPEIIAETGDTAVEGKNGGRDAAETLLAHNEGEEESTLSAVWVLLSTARTASFFMAVVLSGMAAGVIDTFLFIRLEELGGSNKLFGVARLLMGLAEVPFFYVSGPLIERMGVRSVVALAQVAYIVRFLYYSVLLEPWWVLPAEALHGLTFAAMWAATVSYAHEIAPDRQRITVLGLVSGLRWMGMGLGAILGGYLYAGLGASLCFRVCTALPSTALLLLALPTAQSWCGCGGSRRKEEMGEPGLEGWSHEDSHMLAPAFEANGRKDRKDGRDVGDGAE